jgi:large subunit ribosomal protein L21
MYAIIETGGKQLKAIEGKTIVVEKLPLDAGSEYVFDKVLAVNDGISITFGSPYVASARVHATVECEGRHRKVIVYKFKRKKGFHKKKGHKQPFTKLTVNKIVV